MTVRSVAILGGGIMGCSVALELAMRGIKSVVFEREQEVFSGASRWNEGKIHLGYLYSADPTLATARKVLPGGLAFRPLVEQVIGTSIRDAITRSSDLFLCHARSVVAPAAMEDYFHHVTDLVCGAPNAEDYLADVRRADTRRLLPRELAQVTSSPSIVAAFEVPERSVSTNMIADHFVGAVRGTSCIEVRSGTMVTGVNCAKERGEEKWRVVSEDGIDGPFDCVVNALWEGRLAVDQTVHLAPPAEWSHRYRLSLFLRTRDPVAVPSAVIAVGPFGDIKNYDGRDLYLSWYPAGLQHESTELIPPKVDALTGEQSARLSASILEHLSEFMPAISGLAENIEHQEIGGGWVYASGTGSLSNPEATLHVRNSFGISRKGNYLSVDTGKYSTAPWLARSLVSELLGE